MSKILGELVILNALKDRRNLCKISYCKCFLDCYNKTKSTLWEDIMAGGQKINDKGAWPLHAGGPSPLPVGNRIKNFSSADGAGELGDYWDTTEKIKEQQDMGERKVKSNATKLGYRN